MFVVKRYVVCAATGSKCPRCNREPRLLAPDEKWERVIDLYPAFYVCACGYVGQVGIGPVPVSTDEALLALYKLRDL